jgi:integrase
MWILAATTGMRRSELLGVRRDGLDLGAGTLTIDETLISVAGRAEESDGKTDAGVRTVSLDAFTVAALRRTSPCSTTSEQPSGRPTRAAAGCRQGRRAPDPPHDVRHTYSTLSPDTGIEPKILSDRVGHSNPAVTFQIYAHHSTGQNRAAAELIGQLIERAVTGPRNLHRRPADQALTTILTTADMKRPPD